MLPLLRTRGQAARKPGGGWLYEPEDMRYSSSPSSGFLQLLRGWLRLCRVSEESFRSDSTNSEICTPSGDFVKLDVLSLINCSRNVTMASDETRFVRRWVYEGTRSLIYPPSSSRMTAPHNCRVNHPMLLGTVGGVVGRLTN